VLHPGLHDLADLGGVVAAREPAEPIGRLAALVGGESLYDGSAGPVVSGDLGAHVSHGAPAEAGICGV
jgi:hypothetical protein